MTAKRMIPQMNLSPFCLVARLLSQNLLPRRKRKQEMTSAQCLSIQGRLRWHSRFAFRTMSDISEHDRIILNSIFNPFLPIGEPNYDGDLVEELTDDEEITPSVARAKEIEVKGVKAAETGDLDRAERLLTEALRVSERASGYNNRAQVLRLKGNDSAAVLDLNRAIEVSRGRGKAGCQAYCQRALLHRRNGRGAEAKEDLTQAARMGSLFARHQLVEMNPYAAMCNQMLNDMMVKLNGIDCTRNGITIRNDTS